MNQRKFIATAIMAQTAAICSAAQAAPEAKINFERTGMKKTLKPQDVDYTSLIGQSHRSTPAFAIKVAGASTLFSSHQYGTDGDPQARHIAQGAIAKAKGSAMGFTILKNGEPDGSGIDIGKKPTSLAIPTLWRSAAARAKQPAGKQLATL